MSGEWLSEVDWVLPLVGSIIATPTYAQASHVDSGAEDGTSLGIQSLCRGHASPKSRANGHRGGQFTGAPQARHGVTGAVLRSLYSGSVRWFRTTKNWDANTAHSFTSCLLRLALCHVHLSVCLLIDSHSQFQDFRNHRHSGVVETTF